MKSLKNQCQAEYIDVPPPSKNGGTATPGHLYPGQIVYRLYVHYNGAIFSLFLRRSYFTPQLLSLQLFVGLDNVTAKLDIATLGITNLDISRFVVQT